MRALGVALLFGATLAQAQVAPNRNAQRLFASEPAEMPAVWVNPGALGLTGNISVGLDLTVGDPGQHGQLDQISAGFNSHHVAFGYQRDRLPGGVKAHTYRLGVWGTDGRLGLGFTGTLYKGGQGGRAFDIGVLYLLSSNITLGGVLANIGQPVVRGEDLRVRLTPAVALHTPGKSLAILAQATFRPDSVVGLAAGVQATLPLRWPVRLLARLDTDGDLTRTGFSFGVIVGGRDQVGALATTPGDAGRIDALSLHGVSARAPGGSKGGR